MDPTSTEPTTAAAMEAAVSSAIDDIAKEFDAGLAAEQDSSLGVGTETPAPPPAPQETAAAPETAVSAPPAVKPQEPADSPTDAGLERLVAREVATREKERALEAREAALAAREGKRDPVVENLLQGMRTDPETTLKNAGVDVDHALRLMIAKRLGEKAPPELRSAVRDAEIQRELNELRAYNQQIRAQAESQAFFAKVSNDAREYVTAGIDKDVPSLSAVAKDNPQWVHEMVIEEIVRDAQARLANPGAGPDAILSFPEAAKRLERKLNPVLSRANAVSNAATGTTTAPAPATKAPPLAQAPVSPKPTSAPKPLRPWWNQGDDLLELSLKEALAEFRKTS